MESNATEYESLESARESVAVHSGEGTRFLPAVNVTAVQVLNNPCGFLSPFEFQITFEVLRPIDADVEWKITYVGSAASDAHDQILDTVETPMQQTGVFKFVFQAEAPNPKAIPSSDLIGVTVVLLTCSFQGHEFLRVGYYVAVEYEEEELRLEPPEEPIIDKLTRNILADKPRVTRYLIDWTTQDNTDAQNDESTDL